MSKAKAKRNPKVKTVNRSVTAFMDAAEIMLGERGFNGTSMRAVAEKANANLGAINYYFGSKEILVRKVLERSLKPANDERIRILKDQLQTAADHKPDFMMLLKAYIEPMFAIHKVQPIFDKMVLRLITDPAPQVRKLFRQLFDEPTAIFIELARKCHPLLSDEEAYWRLTCITGSISQLLVNRAEIARVTNQRLTFSDEDKGLEMALRSLYRLYMAPPGQ